MEINTQYFGKISCSEKEFIHFSDGLFGFTDLKKLCSSGLSGEQRCFDLPAVRR